MGTVSLVTFWLLFGYFCVRLCVCVCVRACMYEFANVSVVVCVCVFVGLGFFVRVCVRDLGFSGTW